MSTYTNAGLRIATLRRLIKLQNRKVVTVHGGEASAPLPPFPQATTKADKGEQAK